MHVLLVLLWFRLDIQAFPLSALNASRNLAVISSSHKLFCILTRTIKNDEKFVDMVSGISTILWPMWYVSEFVCAFVKVSRQKARRHSYDNCRIPAIYFRPTFQVGRPLKQRSTKNVMSFFTQLTRSCIEEALVYYRNVGPGILPAPVGYVHPDQSDSLPSSVLLPVLAHFVFLCVPES